MLNIVKVIEEDLSYPMEVLREKGIARTILIWGSARILSPKLAQEKFQEAEASGDMIAVEKAKKFLKYVHFYEKAVELSAKLSLWAHEFFPAQQRCVICSGGSGGIMEAANAGASSVGISSIGLNIDIPSEQKTNSYADIQFKNRYFLTRKYLFMKFATAIVIFPGGFGTLDECFEALNLIQTKRQRNRLPIIFFGKAFWKKLINFDLLYEDVLASPQEDIYFSDEIDEVVRIVKKYNTDANENPKEMA